MSFRTFYNKAQRKFTKNLKKNINKISVIIQAAHAKVVTNYGQ